MPTAAADRLLQLPVTLRVRNGAISGDTVIARGSHRFRVRAERVDTLTAEMRIRR